MAPEPVVPAAFRLAGVERVEPALPPLPSRAGRLPQRPGVIPILQCQIGQQLKFRELPLTEDTHRKVAAGEPDMPTEQLRQFIPVALLRWPAPRREIELHRDAKAGIGLRAEIAAGLPRRRLSGEEPSP